MNINIQQRLNYIDNYLSIPRNNLSDIDNINNNLNNKVDKKKFNEIVIKINEKINTFDKVDDVIKFLLPLQVERINNMNTNDILTFEKFKNNNELVNKLKGEKGDQGIQGIPGAKGEKGDTGLIDTSNFYTKSEVENKINSIPPPI